MKRLNFEYDYFKLNDLYFSTIRDASRFVGHRVGEVIEIRLRGKHFCFVEIIGVQLRRIGSLPVEFLRLDGEYPGFVIRSQWDFVGLLNSFRRLNRIRGLDELATVLYLKKVPRPVKKIGESGFFCNFKRWRVVV